MPAHFTIAAQRAAFDERKSFAIAAIEKLQFATDTDEITLDLIAAVRALAGLMPEDADGVLEDAADDLQGMWRKSYEFRADVAQCALLAGDSVYFDHAKADRELRA